MRRAGGEAGAGSCAAQSGQYQGKESAGLETNPFVGSGPVIDGWVVSLWRRRAGFAEKNEGTAGVFCRAD